MSAASTAGSSTPTDTEISRSDRTQRRISSRETRLSSAATSNAAQVTAGRSCSREAKACSRRAVSVVGAGAMRAWSPAAFVAVRASSTSASGLPAASLRMRARKIGCSSGARLIEQGSRRPRHSAARGRGWRGVRRRAESRCPARTAATRTTGSLSSLRAMNVSAPIAGVVKPLRVIDDQDHRASAPRRHTQAERRQARREMDPARALRSRRTRRRSLVAALQTGVRPAR